MRTLGGTTSPARPTAMRGPRRMTLTRPVLVSRSRPTSCVLPLPLSSPSSKRMACSMESCSLRVAACVPHYVKELSVHSSIWLVPLPWLPVLPASPPWCRDNPLAVT
eukprot:UN0551